MGKNNRWSKRFGGEKQEVQDDLWNALEALWGVSQSLTVVGREVASPFAQKATDKMIGFCASAARDLADQAEDMRDYMQQKYAEHAEDQGSGDDEGSAREHKPSEDTENTGRTENAGNSGCARKQEKADRGCPCDSSGGCPCCEGIAGCRRFDVDGVDEEEEYDEYGLHVEDEWDDGLASGGYDDEDALDDDDDEDEQQSEELSVGQRIQCRLNGRSFYFKAVVIEKRRQDGSVFSYLLLFSNGNKMWIVDDGRHTIVSDD